MKVIVWRVEKQ